MLHQPSTKYNLYSYASRSCSYACHAHIWTWNKGTLEHDKTNLRGTYSRRWIINIHFFCSFSFLSFPFLSRACLNAPFTYIGMWVLEHPKVNSWRLWIMWQKYSSTWKSRTCHGSILFNPFPFEMFKDAPTLKQLWSSLFLFSYERTTHSWGTLNLPLQAFRGRLDRGWGGPPKKIWDFFEPNRKLLPTPANFEKNIVLAFLNAACPQISYWVHFTFKVQNPIYICALSLIKWAIEWAFHSQSETINKACN